MNCLIKDQLQKLIFNTVKDVLPEVEISLDYVKLEHPREESHGDYATNVAMILAKRHIGGVSRTFQGNPIEIATKLAQAIKQQIDIVEAKGCNHTNNQRDQRKSGSGSRSTTPDLQIGDFDISGNNFTGTTGHFPIWKPNHAMR